MYKIIIVIFIISTLAKAENSQESITKGQFDARKISNDASLSYLSCYPLPPQDKSICVAKLNDKYINSAFKNDLEYKQHFQYEAEKLGFLKFLVGHNNICKGIDKGPIYNETEKAYKVECICNHQYLMIYDYKIGKWRMK